MRVTIQEAAKLLNMTEQCLRVGLQQDKFEFGTAIKMSNRYTYYINRTKLDKYLGGNDETGKSND